MFAGLELFGNSEAIIRVVFQERHIVYAQIVALNCGDRRCFP